MVNNTHKFLNKNPDIIVTKSDKGGLPIIVKSVKYKDDVKLVLNDQNNYKLLDKNPLKDLKDNLKNLVTDFRAKRYFADYNKYAFSVANTVLLRCYGLYKIQNEGNSIRIIVSGVNSPTIALETYFKNVLTAALPFPKSHIGDSWQFKNKIDNTAIPENHSMILLDATSLFTNIPKKLVINSLKKR